MYLLSDLWYGNVNPCERYAINNSEYKKARKEANESMDRLMELLSPEAKTLLETVLDKHLILTSISEEDTFIRGVRIGAQFILDVIGDYKSQLPQMGEN